MKMQCLPAGPTATAAPPPTPPADDRLLGCGWFDSSHELGAGLQLTVHEAPDQIATLVPLNWWLQWELDECLRTARR